MPQKHYKKSLTLISTLLILTLITSCQTTSPAGTKKVAKVLTAQNTVVDAILKERESQKLQEAIGANDQLLRAEAHLKAALKSLKDSNQKVMEAMIHDEHRRRHNF